MLWLRHFLVNFGRRMNVALIHYWLLTMRGGEKVLQSFAKMFPQADIFSHVIDQAEMARHFPGHALHESFIAKLPLASRLYQNYLPLMPMALEELDLRGFDLVISSESGPAKGVVVSPNTPHICYCHSPMRYAWDMYHDYKAGAGRLKQLLMAPIMHKMRLWDYASAGRVDYFIANSTFVAKRIEKYYRREAEVIHPPVSAADFYVSGQAPDDFYLLLGQLVPYKRADLAVEAFTRLGKRLVVVGEGSEMAALRKIAGPNIEFLGRQPFAKIRELYASCRALIFPGVEDFGIVPLEAMASGRPVIALAKGGALETVVDGQTGIFFQTQSADALIQSVHAFEEAASGFSATQIRAHALGFDEPVFRAKMAEFIVRKTGVAVSVTAP